MKVSNQGFIFKLSLHHFKAKKGRSIIAILAIALTTLLFTSLFTITLSMNQAFQESNFRQVGSIAHGTFKYLSKKQCRDLASDSALKESGIRHILGFAEGDALIKKQVEVSYMEGPLTHWNYIELKQGALPSEGSLEAAMDRDLLHALNIPAKIGEAFSLTINIQGKITEQRFTLSGFWDRDPAIPVHHVLIPDERVAQIVQEVQLPPQEDLRELYVMFPKDYQIHQKMQDLAIRQGYQVSEPNNANYIDIGVNWGYTSSQLSQNLDIPSMIVLLCLLVLIALTGYLIIYNVFQISVAQDIRFYGLFKTIGTTPKQLRRFVRNQALLLSLFGIPLGLTLGYFVGVLLTPMVLNRTTSLVKDVVYFSFWIPLISSFFSLLTVLYSAHRPARLAAKVSPLEALRHSEVNPSLKSEKKTSSLTSPQMAWANIRSSYRRNIISLLSLALALVLFQWTMSFSQSLSMEKYLATMACDFQIADSSYFQVTRHWDGDHALLEKDRLFFSEQPGITASGICYAKTTNIEQWVPENYFRKQMARDYPEEAIAAKLKESEQRDGKIADLNTQLYGMEDFLLSKLRLLQGEIETLKDPHKKAIAAVYQVDDYGKVKEESNWAKVGDTITLRYYRPNSQGQVDTQEVNYQVTAEVVVPHQLNYRFYGSNEFVLSAEHFVQDTNSDKILYLAMDVEADSRKSMEQLLEKQTSKSSLDFESKTRKEKEFEGFQQMFLILGLSLSSIVAFIGLLNYCNALLSNFFSRYHEFALLQAIGMSPRQLRKMILWESFFVLMGSIGLSLLLIFTLSPFLKGLLEKTFWFYDYHNPLWPFLLLSFALGILGLLIPLALHRHMSKRSVVERLQINY